MSYGLRIWDEQGRLVIDYDSVLLRIVGYGTVSFAAGEFTTKSLTIAGLLDTDKLTVLDMGSVVSGYSISRSGSIVSVSRATTYWNSASSYLVVGLR